MHVINQSSNSFADPSNKVGEEHAILTDVKIVL